MKKLNVGIIGLGRVAWMLEDDPLDIHPNTHVGAWAAQKHISIAAGCDIDADRRRLFARRFPQTKVYSNYQEMLAKESLDCVSLCAYATERKEMLMSAVEAGVKGIWCEKAMAASLAEADAMAEALNRQGAAMIVSYLRRWDEPYRRVKQLLKKGIIGRLESINVQFSGNMLHTGTHAFDVMRMFAGDVVSVSAWLESDGEELLPQSGYRYQGISDAQDVGGHAVIHFENGVYGVVHGHAKDYFRFEFDLLGSEGMIRLGNTSWEYWQHAASTHYTGMSELKHSSFPFPVNGNLWVSACANLVAAVRQQQLLDCDVFDGKAALAIGLAMHESHRRNHSPVHPMEVDPALYVESR